MSELDAQTRQEYLSDISTKELADELERRVLPNQPEYDPGAVKVHGCSHGEEGVIVKYIPYGDMGLGKKPETQQYGIYDARIIVVVDGVPRCKMCGDELHNTELNDHDIERGVCTPCYSAEVTAGECFEE